MAQDLSHPAAAKKRFHVKKKGFCYSQRNESNWASQLTVTQ